MLGFNFVENNEVFKSWQKANPDKEIISLLPVVLSTEHTSVRSYEYSTGLMVIFKEDHNVQTNA